MVICYWNFPFLTAIPTWDIEPRDLIRFIHAMIFVNVLIVCSVIDLKHMIIPDVISLPMIALSPVVIYFHPELDWQSSLMGILLGGGVLYGITWAYWLVRHEIGMGMGDVKLLAAIGGWLGYQSILPTIFYGSVLGSTVGIVVLLMSRKFSLQTKIPFGPFLAIGAILHLFLNEFFYELLFIP
jgi:leader peptidase (prepilin peptidase)/N-methyltransferase